MSSKPTPRTLGANLLRAAMSAAPAYMATLLDAGAPIDAELKPGTKSRSWLPDTLRSHPLHRSTALGVCCLLAARPDGDPNVAAEAARCAKLLLARGACPDGAGARTSTPLSCIASQTGMGFLGWPARRSQSAASPREARRIELMNSLAEAGADMDIRDKRGLTPLGECLDHGDRVMAQALIDAGARIDCLDPNGRTEVFNRAFGGLVESLDLALSLGADPDIPDAHGRTALSYILSASTGSSGLALKCPAALIEAGCSVGQADLERIASTDWSKTLMPSLARREAEALAASTPDPAHAASAPFRL